MKVRFLILVSLIAMVNGCAVVKPPMPVATLPLPSPKDAASMSGKSVAKPMVVMPPPVISTTVTLSWDNQPVPAPQNYVTGLESSTDLVNWKSQALMPYATSNYVSISNCVSPIFFRAFNRSVAN